MKRLIIIVLSSLSFLVGRGQVSCIQHWCYNKSQIVSLDSILATVNLSRIDTLYCDSFTRNTRLHPKWYVDFYTKHFGNYFSNPGCVCFAMFYFREKSDLKVSEMHITQFVLSDKQIREFERKYGAISQKQSIYKIEAFTSYKYIVKGNSIYFVSTETYSLAQRNESFFEDMVKHIQRH